MGRAGAAGAVTPGVLLPEDAGPPLRPPNRAAPRPGPPPELQGHPMPILSDNVRGAFFMVMSMSAFTLNDAFMKALGEEVPLFQAVFLRSIAVVALLAFLSWRKDGLRLPSDPRDLKLVVIRSVAEAAAAYFFITALFNMPIANVTAILQSLPLTITLTAAVLFREPLGWRRLTAIFIGFCGVLLIVQPGGDGFSIYSLYVLGAVACVTVRDLATRRLSRAIPSMSVALAAAVAVLVFSGVASIFVDWVPLRGERGLQLGGAVLFVVAAYLTSVMAMRVGEVAFVAPFRYTGLLVAILLGVLFFGETPGPLVLTGSALIAATGIFTLWRERRFARRRMPVMQRLR